MVPYLRTVFVATAWSQAFSIVDLVLQNALPECLQKAPTLATFRKPYDSSILEGIWQWVRCFDRLGCVPMMMMATSFFI